jgi:hypothetical protein
MDGLKALEVKDATEVPVVRRRASGNIAGSGRTLLPRQWGLFAAFVGPVVAAICMAVEPAPADPNAPEPLAAAFLGVALMTAWGAAAVTGLRRLPQALGWACVVSVLSIAMSISCPLSGHHTSIGAWWAIQLAVSVGALAYTLTGMQRVRTLS